MTFYTLSGPAKTWADLKSRAARFGPTLEGPSSVSRNPERESPGNDAAMDVDGDLH